jgi:hypothetical protein
VFLTRHALNSRVQAKRNVGIGSSKVISHAEGYQSLLPRVTEDLSCFMGGRHAVTGKTGHQRGISTRNVAHNDTFFIHQSYQSLLPRVTEDLS